MATDRFLGDRESFNALVDMMPEPEQAAYTAMRSLCKESAFPGRRFVVYEFKGGGPQILDILSCGPLLCDKQQGPYFDLADSRGNMTVQALPKRVRPYDVFMQVPQTFTWAYKARADSKSALDFTSHYAVLIKTRSRDDMDIDGHHYCVTVKRFRDRFPHVNIRF